MLPRQSAIIAFLLLVSTHNILAQFSTGEVSVRLESYFGVTEGLNTIQCGGSGQSSCSSVGLSTPPLVQNRWGVPEDTTDNNTITSRKADTPQSGLGFNPLSEQIVQIGGSFYIGSLTHFNYPVDGSPNTTSLRLTFTFWTVPDATPLGMLSVPIPFTIAETPNNVNRTDCPYISAAPCADRIAFDSAATTANVTFAVNNANYTFRLLGFHIGQSVSSPVTSNFITEENTQTNAYLFGQIVSRCTLSQEECAATNQTLNELTCQCIQLCGNGIIEAGEECDSIGDSCCVNCLINTGSCDDLNACTTNDQCVSGVCTGTPLCEASEDACSETKCDPILARCVTSPKLNGTLCDDRVNCTINDVCYNGVCLGRNVTRDDNFPELWEVCLDAAVVPPVVDPSEDDDNTGVIVGAVIGSVAGVALLTLAGFIVYRKFFAAKSMPAVVPPSQQAFSEVNTNPFYSGNELRQTNPFYEAPSAV